MLFLDSGYTSLNKTAEELCGDKVEITRTKTHTTMVLADGLGSGVKANILSTLSSKILCTMVSNEIPIEDCVETLIMSLPVCKVRQVAYSTFSIIHMDNNGKGLLFEFDNPQAIYVKEGKAQDFEREKLIILGKTVYKTHLSLEKDQIIVLMSDGCINAGIGKILNFGWERKEICDYLTRTVKPYMSARSIACLLGNACNDLYLNSPGDDTTVAVLKVREKTVVNIMVGPPVDKTRDDEYISEFLSGEGKKVVCGGTSSTIVARYLKQELITKFEFPDKDVPPIGEIKGIDLTTEGFLTLRKLLTLSEKYLNINDLSPKYFTKKDGASLLADMLFEQATTVNFFVGQSVNIAHQGLPIDTTMKLKLVETLSKNLISMGKEVTVKYF